MEDENEDYELTRMRVKNRLLGRRVEKLQNENDVVFTAFCESGDAQAAIYEIWEAADLSCEPQDYDIVVEYALTAIKAYQQTVVDGEEQY